jgi:carbonic anhydrase/acetyltransferase-like protein (isoleucine patch superfamily)
MTEMDAILDRHLRQKPTLGEGVYIADGAVVVGDVTLGEGSSVWYNAVLRGDINRILVGNHTNIQDGAVLHLEQNLPCVVGNYVTIGHMAIVHACTVGDESLIGMGAVVLDGAKIGNQCLVGARSLVTKGKQIPDGSLVIGSPAEVVRSLTAEERAALRTSAERYAANAAYCLKHEINVSSPKSKYLFWE